MTCSTHFLSHPKIKSGCQKDQKNLLFRYNYIIYHWKAHTKKILKGQKCSAKSISSTPQNLNQGSKKNIYWLEIFKSFKTFWMPHPLPEWENEQKMDFIKLHQATLIIKVKPRGMSKLFLFVLKKKKTTTKKNKEQTGYPRSFLQSSKKNVIQVPQSTILIWPYYYVSLSFSEYISISRIGSIKW